MTTTIAGIMTQSVDRYAQTCEAILLPSVSTVMVAIPVEVSSTRPTFSESESIVYTDFSLELGMVEKDTKTTYFCVAFFQ